MYKASVYKPFTQILGEGDVVCFHGSANTTFASVNSSNLSDKAKSSLTTYSWVFCSFLSFFHFFITDTALLSTRPVSFS